MVKYHGTPITPNLVLGLVAEGNNFCVSYYNPQQAQMVLRMGQSVMWDNGAYSFFTHKEKPEWGGYYRWLDDKLFHPHWAVIPDVIGGTVEEQRALELSCPLSRKLCAPVYHLSEPLDRFRELLDRWDRICLGGSVGENNPGSEAWKRSIDAVWDVVAKSGAKPWIHMLRAMAEASKGPWPFASADSASFARNHSQTKNCFQKLEMVNMRNPSRELDLLRQAELI